jgi:tRNA1(Val) A37 N6-methylase TrmN6
MTDKSFTDNAILGGAIMLRQPRRGHRVGHDAVLLAAATPARPGDHAVELGAGVGAAGLALARRVPELSVTLVEIDPELAALAARNAESNGFSHRMNVAALDVGAPARAFTAAGLMPGGARRILMNPPFNDPARHEASPDAQRRQAHAAAHGALAHWTRKARVLLANAGTLTLIWRADGLADVLAALGRGFGDVAILPVYPRPDAAAIRILVSATKGSRAPLTLLPGLKLNGADGRPTKEAEAVLRGGEALALARR